MSHYHPASAPAVAATVAPATDSRTDTVFAWALLAAMALAWIATLGTRSLVSADEGRYATLSLAMLQSGDWITPRLNGILYFEKPPLQYWGGALAMALFGVNEFAARLYPGLAGLATVAMLGHTASTLWGRRAGLHALLIGGSCTWIALNSHFLALDAGLCATLTGVLCAVLLAERPGAGVAAQRRWMLAAWAGMALAVLSKGLVGILIPGAVLVLVSFWRLDFGIWRRLQWGGGALLLALIAVPWFVLVSQRNPGFAEFFFIHEHFQRFLTPVARREGAWWYFLPFLAVGLLPWTGALPWLLRPRRSDFAGSLLWLWALFVLLFFSVSSSKLPSYILPMFPALALLAARELALVRPERATLLRWHLVLPAGVAIAGLALLSQGARLHSAEVPAAAVDGLLRGVAFGAALLLAGVVAAWWLLGRRRITAALALLAAAHLGATLAVLQSHDAYGQLKSADALARALLPQIGPATPVFAVRDYDQTLPFYLHRNAVLVDYRDEFDFGLTREPQLGIATLAAFAARWQAEPRAAAYMKRETLAESAALGIQGRVVYTDARRTVIVKP